MRKTALLVFLAVIFLMLCQKKPLAPSGNVAPVFPELPSAMRNTAYPDSLFTDTLHAVDANGNPVQLTLVSGPSGLQLVDSVIFWIPQPSSPGTNPITVMASDGAGGSTLFSWEVRVDQIWMAGLVSLAQAIQAEVAAFRGKSFLRTVTPVIRTRTQHAADMAAEGSGSSYTDAEKQMINRVLIFEGFLLTGDNYFSESDSIIASFVGGYYKPGSDSVWVILEDTATGLDTNTRLTLFHEYVHALQDQYYSDLLNNTGSSSADRYFATASCVEGEAEYLSTFYEYKVYAGSYPPVNFDMLLFLQYVDSRYDSLLSSLHSEGERYYVYQPFLWRYSKGALFMNRYTPGNDWTRIDAIFSDPPVRMQEVLTVYAPGMARPNYVIGLNSLFNRATDDGFEVLDYDEWGALLGSALFREWGHSDSSLVNGLVSDIAGVTGTVTGDSLCLAWYTVWKTPAAMDSFFNAYTGIAGQKYGVTLSAASSTAQGRKIDDTANRFYMETNGTLTPNTCMVLERYPAMHKTQWVDALRGSAVSAWSAAAKSKSARADYPVINKTGKKDIWF